MAHNPNPYGGGNANPGGPGGHRGRIRPAAPGGGGGQPPKKKCCPMVAAVHSAKEGKFKLARRYAAMSARLILARI